MISVKPWLFPLPIGRKALNALILDVCFCFNSKLLMFQLDYLFWLQNLLYILAPSLPLWRSPSELYKILSYRCKSSVCPWNNKTQFSARLCIFFSQYHFLFFLKLVLFNLENLLIIVHFNPIYSF